MKKYNKIVLNIPHSSDFGIDGWDNKERLIQTSVKKWTDWHTDKIFSPSACFDGVVIPCVFPYSRFYIDVERLVNDPLEQIGEGIIYTHKDGFNRTVTPEDRQSLMSIYDKHMELLRSKITDGNTLLLDCHSFPSELSNTSICLGFNDDESYDEETVVKIKSHFEQYGYKVSLNEPYSNSIYPQKDFAYNSVMIEINKKLYMSEETTALYSDSYKIGNAINSLYRELLHYKD